MLLGWLLGEPVMREEEDSALQAMAVREEEDSPSHLGEPITVRESPFRLELGRRVAGRPFTALPTIHGLCLSLCGW